MRTEMTSDLGRCPGLPTPSRDRERGSSLMEYCLLVALIALVTVSALASFGSARDEVFGRAASSIAGP